jgi:hypothetical protein
MIVAFEIVPIAVKHLPRAFDMGLIPIGFDLSSIGKGNNSKTILLAVNKITGVERAIEIKVFPLSILLAFAPHAIVDIPIRVLHSTYAILDIIPPLSLIDVSVRIAIAAKALLSVFNYSLEALPILKYVVALDEGVVLPSAKVDVVGVVDVDAKAIPLVVGADRSVVDIAIQVLFLDYPHFVLQLSDEIFKFREKEGALGSFAQ